MIKCSLIDVTTDNRAVICVGEEKRGHCSVKQTRKLDWINYDGKTFYVGGQFYDFSR